MDSSLSNRVSASLRVGKFAYGTLTTKPDALAAWKNERLVKVWLGTSANQWSKVAKPRASVESPGSCSGV